MSAGLIPAWGINRLWFSAGVFVGGLIMAGALGSDETMRFSWVSAIIAGLASAGAFLLCFDKEGDFHWYLALPAAGVAFLVAVTLKIPVLGGVAGLFFFLIVGYLAVLIRYIFLGLGNFIMPRVRR